jgi:FAD:protein FMN transferase
MKLLFIVLGLGCFVQFSLASEDTLQRFEFEEKHMGTLFRLVCYANKIETAQEAAKAGFARVAKLNRIMSDYDPSSELMQLCKKFDREIGENVKVSPELFSVLKKANEVSNLSDGAFDVSVGPIVKLWRLSRRTQQLPDPKELQDALSKVGYDKIQLNEKDQSVKLLTPGMQLDLGGIAKGYAADEVIDVCEKLGIHHVLVAAGGDITVSKAPPGTNGWKVEIAPLPGSKEKRVLKLENAAVSTSGDAENYVLIDGVRYSHIVDPKTGIGLTGQRSVTVIARRGITADSCTKMASILSPDKAFDLMEKLGIDAIYIVRKKNQGQEETKASKSFEKYLVEKDKK